MCKKRRREKGFEDGPRGENCNILQLIIFCYELYCELPKVVTKCIHASIQHIMELIMLKIQAQLKYFLVPIVGNSCEPSSIGLFQLFNLVRFIFRFKLLSQKIYLGVI